MYTLRELDISFWGLFMLVVLILFVFLKFLNPTRFESMVFFWKRTSSNSEFNKPFNETKAFSWVGFIFRALIFGLMMHVFLSESLNTNTFGLAVLSWAGIFMMFWLTRTLLEGGVMAMMGKNEGLLKIFYIRTIFKEKWAFVFGCVSLMLIYASLPAIATRMLTLVYLFGLVAIHIRFLKLYFRNNPIKKVYIILYICTSEIGPVWLLTQTLIF
jgi:hypothetical protein